ncbi:MFS transporter [Roseibium sp. RKSG952]|uniref:MFS transporter n=1 Tax=Roseibium sp. RKSG952 TaxID=2529384 RepID=UPI0012BD150F|nr:MFS transporter [Roseibium sp. RKSG952]MTI01114.1 MFS transporter [Roseibium sp. RKSG952]
MLQFPRPPREGLFACLLILVGNICVSSLIPLMSYYIVDHLEKPAWMVSVYVGLVAVLSMMLNRAFGEKLDRSAPVRTFLTASILAFIVYSGLLAVNGSYWLLLVAGVPLMSIANTANGVAFTFGRLLATERGYDVARMNSWLRMSVSLAWMIGPAAAFSLVALSGFPATFTVSAGIGIFWFLLMIITVPKQFRAPAKNPGADESGKDTPQIWIAAATVTLFVITNVLYLSAMPLYFIKEVGLAEFAPGLSVSVKCFVEIFAIFGSVWLARRIQAPTVLMISAALSVLTMMLFAQVETLSGVLFIAVLDGLYYGIVAGIALTFIQSFAPDRPGRATAVYMNSLFLGSMIGQVSMGFIADAFDFRTVVYCAAAAGFAALLMLLATRAVTARTSARVPSI